MRDLWSGTYDRPAYWDETAEESISMAAGSTNSGDTILISASVLAFEWTARLTSHSTLRNPRASPSEFRAGLPESLPPSSER
jgi:hypothetical protein